MTKKPWQSWPADERWQMMAEYQRGASLMELVRRYHRRRNSIADLLRSAGMLRERNPDTRTMKRHSTPQLRDFCRVLLSSQGTGLNMAELLDSMRGVPR